MVSAAARDDFVEVKKYDRAKISPGKGKAGGLPGYIFAVVSAFVFPHGFWSFSRSFREEGKNPEVNRRISISGRGETAYQFLLLFSYLASRLIQFQVVT